MQAKQENVHQAHNIMCDAYSDTTRVKYQDFRKPPLFFYFLVSSVNFF